MPDSEGLWTRTSSESTTNHTVMPCHCSTWEKVWREIFWYLAVLNLNPQKTTTTDVAESQVPHLGQKCSFLQKSRIFKSEFVPICCSYSLLLLREGTRYLEHCCEDLTEFISEILMYLYTYVFFRKWRKHPFWSVLDSTELPLLSC